MTLGPYAYTEQLSVNELTASFIIKADEFVMEILGLWFWLTDILIRPLIVH